ncbi:Gfo/Idh/MocA family protein [Cucumibacter marinus]|uniref:Gfo/Idh/MocA family protein n=1 Tax=Cucumibacter marinus TaxID=1121252 RepID=UPI0004012A4C|nr:Gfo/Idh/MocA family oxidoreductase [Cucumibacter marinus]
MAGALGWGILATGGIAHSVAGDLKLAGCRIAAVGSRNVGNAKAFAREFGVPKAHGAYEALVADPDVDIVYVATPHPMHADNARLALEAGKHVLVEKAFTLNAGEAREIVDLAREKNLLIMEAMWSRFLPHMRAARELIAQGGLGTVRRFHAEHVQALPEDPAHRLNAPELGGGALLDLGVYPISLSWYLLGQPVAMQASARMGPTGVDKEVTIVTRHAGDAVATHTSASDIKGANRATITGSEGRMEMDGVWYAPSRLHLYDRQGEFIETREYPVEGRGRQFQALEMESLIELGEIASPIMPPEESVAIMALMDDVRARIGLVYPQEAGAGRG